MPSEQQNTRPFPSKRLEFHGKLVQFKKIDTDFNRSGIFVTHPYETDGAGKPLSFRKYPSIYSTKLSSGFVYLWDVLREEYVENLGLINYEQFSLYNYIASLRNSGWHVSVKGHKRRKLDADGKRTAEIEEVKGLAQITGRWWPKVAKDLDHLEDCLLIHRVRRPDLPGCPNEIIIHTPFAEQELVRIDRTGQRIEGIDPMTGEWIEGMWTPLLRQRVEQKATATRLAAIERHTIKKKLVDGKHKNVHVKWHDHRAEAERFIFDFRPVSAAFGDNVDLFAYWAMQFFKKNWQYLYSDKSAFEHDYRHELGLGMSRWGIHDDAQRSRCYVQANKFRTIYCPTEEELVAV
jgi:hypothetical protein